MQKLAILSFILSLSLSLAFTGRLTSARASRGLSSLKAQGDGLKIDMRGKTVFVGGVADSTGYGWAIAKACAEAGAKVMTL